MDHGTAHVSSNGSTNSLSPRHGTAGGQACHDNGVSRELPDPGFAGDDGTADATLMNALTAWAAGGPAGPVHAALVGSRVMVPVIAVAMDVDVTTGADQATDMALVTIRGEDGRTALPAFTSLDSLAAWNPQARPVPVEASTAALAAVAERADLLVLDAAGPVTFRVEGPALRAIAQGRAPLAPLADPAVAAAVRDVVELVPAFAAAVLLPAGADSGADAVLGLRLAAGGPEETGAGLADRAAAAAGHLGAALAADPVLRDRLDRGLDLAVLPATVDLAALGGVVVLARDAS